MTNTQDHRQRLTDAMLHGAYNYKMLMDQTGLSKAQVGRGLMALYLQYNVKGLHTLRTVLLSKIKRQ